MPEAKMFTDILDKEEFAANSRKFPVLYFHMHGEYKSEQYVVIRRMRSKFYNSTKSLAMKFYKPISKMG